MFQAGVPARKFRDYVCVGTQAMAQSEIKRENEVLHVEAATAHDDNGIEAQEGRKNLNDLPGS